MPIATCPECQSRQFVPAGEATECDECGRIFRATTPGYKGLLPVAIVVGGCLLIAVVAVILASEKPRPEEQVEVAKGPAPTTVPGHKLPPPTSRPEKPSPKATPGRPTVPDNIDLRPDTGKPGRVSIPPFVTLPMVGGNPPDPKPSGFPDVNPPPDPIPAVPFKSDRPAKEAFSGYYLRKVEGFNVYVSRLAYEESDAAEGEPLNVVDDELTRIADLFPEPSLKALRKVAVWVEWDHTRPRNVSAFAIYYGSTGQGLVVDGVDPRKAGCVCVLSLKTAYALRAKRGARQNTVLHEFAHVVHDKVYGFDNAFIRNAYEQARARGLYDEVSHDAGGKGPAYARTNAAEYFAELTCAYLDRLDYSPHDAKELREHDSVGYELMTKSWGTPEQIAQAKKKADAKRGKK